MHPLIDLLKTGADLSAREAAEAVAYLAGGEAAEEPKAALLRALREKGETAEEIAGFALALLARAVDPELDPQTLPGPMLDVCGTGGDRLELFNISTTSMFVLAAGGATVVKHGNRAITSKCGGADVLEALGVRIDLPPAALRRCLAEVGAAFIFAPAYHPAFRAIAPVRRKLAAEGTPTIFNLLGPLLNPARPEHQLVGVFDPALLPKYAATLQVLGRRRAWAAHGDGMDELSTTGPSEIHEALPTAVRKFFLAPETLGLAPATREDLRGGDCATNARRLVEILEGADRGPASEIVLLNAAAGFVVAGLAPDLEYGLEHARRQIVDGRALAVLRAMQAWS